VCLGILFGQSIVNNFRFEPLAVDKVLFVQKIPTGLCLVTRGDAKLRQTRN